MNPCEELAARIAVENDPAVKKQLEEQFERECRAGAADDSGGHGGTVPR